MGLLQIDRSSDERSDELRTRRDVLATYLRHGSPRVMLAASVLVLVVRLLVGAFGWIDLALVAATVLMTGFVEWVLHLFLLHAPEDSARMTKLGTGTGHRRHHLDPHDVGWILLSAQDAAIFVVLIAGWTAIWSLPIIWLSGSALLPAYLSAVLAAYVTLAHYEWTHLLVHTRYRPKSRYYKRLAANHRLHHYRNELHWLGVTSNLGDRFLGTLPADKSDVPLSDTARTLS